MSARARLPAGEPRKAGQRNARRAAPTARRMSRPGALAIRCAGRGAPIPFAEMLATTSMPRLLLASGFTECALESSAEVQTCSAIRSSATEAWPIITSSAGARDCTLRSSKGMKLD